MIQLVSFNFSKISAERHLNFTLQNINTNIEFISIDKDKLDLIKDNEILNIKFKLTISYTKKEDKKTEEEKQGEVFFEGNLIVSTDKEEAKNILKQWKKKEINPQIKLPLFNTILERCAAKALKLEEEVNLPFHIPIPKIQPKQQ